MVELTPEDERRLEVERRLIAEKAREDNERHQKQLKEEREHHQKQMAHEARNTHKTMLTSILAALIGLGGALGAAYIAGKKVTPDPMVSALQTIANGIVAVVKLVTPGVPLNKIVPDAPPSQTQPQINPPTPTVPAPVSYTPDTLSTDPNVLANCSVGSPLKVERVRVDATSNGYALSIKVQNTGQDPLALWSDGLKKLNDDASTNYEDGSTNLPMSNFGTYNDTSLAASFTQGIAVKPTESDVFEFRFAQGQPPKGRAVTLVADLSYILKGTGTTYTRQRTSLSCQNLPVMTGAPAQK